MKGTYGTESEKISLLKSVVYDDDLEMMKKGEDNEEQSKVTRRDQ